MKRLVLMAFISLVCFAASTGVQAQRGNQKLGDLPFVQVLFPDLFVSGLSVRQGAGGIIQNVTVTVKNTCGVPSASSYVLVTFMDKAGAGGKDLYYVGNSVKALKGGESQTQTFDVSAKKLPYGSHVSAMADPDNKVKEDSEGNNFRKLNPNTAPFPDNGATHCKAKG